MIGTLQRIVDALMPEVLQGNVEVADVVLRAVDLQARIGGF